MKNYKYKTCFSGVIEANSQITDSLVSKANLESLRSLIPSSIDYHENMDLLPISFNVAVANMFNKNYDGINGATAVRYAKNFKHKPINIEHDEENIIGHIVSVGFSDYVTNEILYEHELSDYDKPFNISLGAVLYKSIDSSYVDLVIDSLNKDSSNYRKISASWEIGFNSYVIAEGGPNLANAKIYNDEESLSAMNPILKQNGGAGVSSNGQTLNRLLVGQVYPLAAGLTTNPAAHVKGLVSLESKTFDSPIILENNNSKISHNEKHNVKKENDMEPNIEKVIAELKNALSEKDFSEKAVANMTSVFDAAIKEKDQEYRDQLKAAEDEKQAVIAKQVEIEDKVEKLTKDLAEANQLLDEHSKAEAERAAVARFDGFMQESDATYELDEEDRQFLAQEAKNKSEEELTSFASSLSKLWKNKTKEAIAALKEETDKKIAEASKKSGDSLEDALNKAKPTDKAVANASGSEDAEGSLTSKYKDAFSMENVKIS